MEIFETPILQFDLVEFVDKKCREQHDWISSVGLSIYECFLSAILLSQRRYLESRNAEIVIRRKRELKIETLWSSRPKKVARNKAAAIHGIAVIINRVDSIKRPRKLAINWLDYPLWMVSGSDNL